MADEQARREQHGSAGKRGAFAALRRVWPHLEAGAAYGALASCKNLAFFPFVRTTIGCASAIAAVNRHSAEWSGSPRCTDLDYVARQAQFVKGLAEALDQGVHCLMLPLLGHAVDCFGRRWGVMVGALGVTLQAACFAAAAMLDSESASHALVVAGSVLQGATGIFGPALQASIRDMQLRDESATHGSHLFGALQSFQGLAHALALVVAVRFILSRNLDSYAGVWTVLATASAGLLLMVMATFPETLPERQTWSWRKASPLSIVDMVRGEPAHRWLAACVFSATLSLSSLSVVQAFTVSAFRWTQTYSTVFFAVLTPVAATSMAASFHFTPRFGPFAVVQAAFALNVLGMLLVCFAPFGPGFLLAGVGAIAAGAGSAPAFMQIVTGLSEANKTGELLANVMAVALAAVALGNLAYSTVFRAFPSAPAAGFAVGGLPLAVLALAAFTRLRRCAESDFGARVAYVPAKTEEVQAL